MFYFIYGQDSYRSKEKLNAIKEKYINASLGDINLAIADIADKNIDFTQITRMVLAMPFLAKKRLVIINNLLSSGKKAILEGIGKLLSKVPETTLLVFYENSLPDRRSSLFKKLLKEGQVQEYKPLEGYQLQKWVEEKIQSSNAKFEKSAVEKLIAFVGNDLWRMDNEIKKVTNYTLQITCRDVEMLVHAQKDSNVFNFIDNLASGNTTRAVKELNMLQAAGKNELYILTMIVYQFRNLLIIKDLAERGKSINEIIKESKLHPFVVTKTLAQAKRFSLAKLKSIYKMLLDYDLKIKSGKIEARLALNMLIFKISK